MAILSLLIVISFISLFVGLMMLIITSTLGIWAKVTLLSALVLAYCVVLIMGNNS